jgi:hypothetical protein
MVAASGMVDFESLTGQSKFVIDMVSIPIFSAIAGLVTAWTGVIMLFAPIQFRGFHCPGVKTIFPFLPRRLQVLPIFAPGGILGFQGFTLDLRRLDPRGTGMSGLAHLALSTTVRVTGAAVRGTVTVGVDLVREVVSGEPVTEIADRHVEALRAVLVRVLGLNGHVPQAPAPVERDAPSPEDPRALGDALLRKLSDPDRRVRNEHPAFAWILRELLPDEARILRFMALAGPQPAIDVRTRTPLGVGSELIASGINLVAEMSGCAHPDRNQKYLANLVRLGMLMFSEEQVEDPRRYSFVEAQPVAAAAMARARKTVTVYRSIRITQFGLQFCDVCFTLNGYDAGGWLKDVR